MKVIRAIDEYFIGNGEGTGIDRVWFYAQYVVYVTIAAIALF